jgi:hypothetical protein
MGSPPKSLLGKVAGPFSGPDYGKAAPDNGAAFRIQ